MWGGVRDTVGVMVGGGMGKGVCDDVKGTA